MDPIRVEITPVVVDADPDTLTQRANVVRRLGELGHIDATTGAVSTTMTAGWQATVNGTAMPLDAFAVEPDEDGRVLVTLVVAADEVSVRRSPAAPPAPAAAPETPKSRRRVWGEPGTADPREGIPGWNPEQTAQASPERLEPAGSLTQVHDHSLAEWTCGCDPYLVGIEEAAAATGNINLRLVEAESEAAR